MAKIIKEDQDKPVKNSYMIRPLLNKQMKYICLTEGGNPSQLIDQVMSEYIAAWEKKNGPIPVK